MEGLASVGVLEPVLRCKSSPA